MTGFAYGFLTWVAVGLLNEQLVRLGEAFGEEVACLSCTENRVMVGEEEVELAEEC